VIETWQSTCPRLTVWEDALADGLVRIRPGPERHVVVEPQGLVELERYVVFTRDDAP
jgi:hypothetical protein